MMKTRMMKKAVLVSDAERSEMNDSHDQTEGDSSMYSFP
jgi:hypothetical protein